MWKLIKKAKRCLWWVIIRKTVGERERESSFEYGPVCASVQHPGKTNLLLLFIFMNSCHLAQCEMMGHSCATRRAGAEFKITHTILHSSPSPPTNPPPLIAHAWMICWIWMAEERAMAMQREFFWLRLLLSPVSYLRRCGTRINGIQQHGEIAAGSVCLIVCVCVCSNYFCAAGELQDSISLESQLVNVLMSDWPNLFFLNRNNERDWLWTWKKRLERRVNCHPCPANFWIN